MPVSDPHTLRCRCCGEAFQSRRIDAETCSPKCRQRVKRALDKGHHFEWGTLAHWVIDRRPPGLGVRRLEAQRKAEIKRTGGVR